MYKTIWDYIQNKRITSDRKNGYFLLSTMILFGLLGMILGMVIRCFVEMSLGQLLCFAGYPGIILGFLYPIFYLYNHEFE